VSDQERSATEKGPAFFFLRSFFSSKDETMAAFQPNQLLDTALRQLATELGISAAQGRQRTDIERDLHQQHPNLVLLSVPILVSPGANRGGRWAAISATVAGVTAIITLFIAIANWQSTAASQAMVTQTREDKEEDKKTSWQAAKVFEIVDDGGKDAVDYKGMTFDDIMTKYTSASVKPEEKVKLGVEEFSPFRLRKILIGLQEAQLVYRTWDNKYIAQKTSVNTKEDAQRVEASQKVIREILRTLRESPGVKADELEKRVKTKVGEVVPYLKDDDYLFSLFQLASQNLISVDTERRVWTPLHSPEKR
jgi:hypothetical protein